MVAPTKRGSGHWGVGMGWVVGENLEWYLAWLNSFFGVLRYPKNMQHVYLVILEYQWFLTIKVIKGTNRWWDGILMGATGLGWWMVMHRVRHENLIKLDSCRADLCVFLSRTFPRACGMWSWWRFDGEHLILELDVFSIFLSGNTI